VRARSEWTESFLTTTEELKEDNTMGIDSEMSRMSFKLIRHSVDRNMSLDRNITKWKARTINEPTYEDEFAKNLTTEICYEAINTKPNSIYILINIWLGGIINMNCAPLLIVRGYSIYFRKRSLFSEFTWKKSRILYK